MIEPNSNKRTAISPVTRSSLHYITLQLGGQPGRLSTKMARPARGYESRPAVSFREPRLPLSCNPRNVGIKLDPISAFHKSRSPMITQCRTMAG